MSIFDQFSAQTNRCACFWPFIYFGQPWGFQSFVFPFILIFALDTRSTKSLSSFLWEVVSLKHKLLCMCSHNYKWHIFYLLRSTSHRFNSELFTPYCLLRLMKLSQTNDRTCVFLLCCLRKTFATVSSQTKRINLKCSKSIPILFRYISFWGCSASPRLIFSHELKCSSSSSLLLLVLKSVGSTGCSSPVCSCSCFSTSGLTLALIQGFHVGPLWYAGRLTEPGCVTNEALLFRALLLLLLVSLRLRTRAGLSSVTLASGGINGIGLVGSSFLLRGTVATQKSPTWSCLQSSISLPNISGYKDAKEPKVWNTWQTVILIFLFCHMVFFSPMLSDMI